MRLTTIKIYHMYKILEIHKELKIYKHLLKLPFIGVQIHTKKGEAGAGSCLTG